MPGVHQHLLMQSYTLQPVSSPSYLSPILLCWHLWCWLYTSPTWCLSTPPSAEPHPATSVQFLLLESHPTVMAPLVLAVLQPSLLCTSTPPPAEPHSETIVQSFLLGYHPTCAGTSGAGCTPAQPGTSYLGTILLVLAVHQPSLVYINTSSCRATPM